MALIRDPGKGAPNGVTATAMNKDTNQSCFTVLYTRCPFHKFAASQAAARLYGLGG